MLFIAWRRICTHKEKKMDRYKVNSVNSFSLLYSCNILRKVLRWLWWQALWIVMFAQCKSRLKHVWLSFVCCLIFHNLLTSICDVCAYVHYIFHHSRPQSPRTFWPVAGIKSSGWQLWQDLIFWVCAEYLFRILNKSDLPDLTGSPRIADFRFWIRTELSIPAKGQKDRGLWWREWFFLRV